MRKNALRQIAQGDTVAVIAVGITVSTFLVLVDSFEWLHAFSRAHERWEVDELFTIIMVASLLLGFLLYRRARALRLEVVRRRDAEQLAQALARQDPLTGVANRRAFEEECDRRIFQARRGKGRFSLLFIDLDRFKEVNDVFGHACGDRLLQLIVERLKRNLGPDDFIGRFGGDEFAIIASSAGRETESRTVAERVLETVAGPATFFGRSVSVAASIGVAVYPVDGQTRETLVKHADSAMYRAKGSERGRIVRFSKEDDYPESSEERSLSGELEGALHSGQIIPYFQPIRDCRKGRVLAVEVLARWLHPRLGLLGADDFIPMIEAGGLSSTLFRVILHQACAQAKGWPGDIHLCVNVTPHQLADRDFVRALLAILEEHRFPASRLEIEVTEDALIVDLEVTKGVIRSLKHHGVLIALDDFGTGYSSLRQLRELPFDRLKIDRSFVSGLGTDRQSEEIVSSTIRLCNALGLKNVVEGVEDETQLAWIKAHGADAAQGYLFGQPMPADEIAIYLRR